MPNMLIRRTAAIGAAAIAIAGISAGQAQASAHRPTAPRHFLEKQGMYVAGFDAAVAKAHGYKIVTYANGDMQSVPINPRSGLPKGTLVKASHGVITPDNSASSGKIPGDCGDSWINGVQTGPHKITLTSGFDVDIPAVKYRWKILLRDINGDSEQGDGGELLEDFSWTGKWEDLNQYVFSVDQVENNSYAILTDGETCYSGGPLIDWDIE